MVTEMSADCFEPEEADCSSWIWMLAKSCAILTSLWPAAPFSIT
jgi:hypothetical protein